MCHPSALTNFLLRFSHSPGKVTTLNQRTDRARERQRRWRQRGDSKSGRRGSSPTAGVSWVTFPGLQLALGGQGHSCLTLCDLKRLPGRSSEVSPFLRFPKSQQKKAQGKRTHSTDYIYPLFIHSTVSTFHLVNPFVWDAYYVCLLQVLGRRQ